MIPRRINIEFESTPMHWARNHEFATMMNSVSPMPSQAEPYLNTVMATIRNAVGKKNPQLASDLDVFIKQEANHFRLHRQFNQRLYAFYPELKAVEAELEKDYKSFLANRSLKFNAAYSAGFENLALFLAQFFFGEGRDMFDGADGRMTALFLWHYGEEFEHRCVAHDAFKAVSGNYFRRIHGAFVALAHLGKYKKILNELALKRDRASMSAEEVAASIRREKAFNARMNRFTLPRMLKLLIPFYDPKKQRMPEGLEAALKYYEAAALDPDWKPA